MFRQAGRFRLNLFRVDDDRPVHPLWVVTIFTALSLITFRETILHFNSRFLGGDSDVFVNQWSDWWTWQWLSGQSDQFWFTDHMFFPDGISLTFHSFSHFTALFTLALQPLFGQIVASNLVTLISHILTGIAFYQFARYLSGSSQAAFLGAIFFSFNAHTLFQTSHLVLFHLWLFPWFALCYLRGIRESGGKWSYLAGCLLAVSALISPLHFILMSIWFGMWLLLTLLVKTYGTPSWRHVLITGSIGMFAVVLLTWPLIRVGILGTDQSFLRSAAGSIPTPLTGFWTPNWLSFSNRKVYLGVVPVILLVLQMRSSWRRLWPWLVYFLIIGLFAIGPVVQLGSNSLAAPWSELVIKLLRHTHRLNGLLSLCVAIMITICWQDVAVAGKRAQLKQLLFFGAALLLFLDLIWGVGAQYHKDAVVSPFYADWLPEQPDGVLAIVPYGRQPDKRNMYLQTVHGRPMTGGVVSRSSEDSLCLRQPKSIACLVGYRDDGIAGRPARVTGE